MESLGSATSADKLRNARQRNPRRGASARYLPPRVVDSIPSLEKRRTKMARLWLALTVFYDTYSDRNRSNNRLRNKTVFFFFFFFERNADFQFTARNNVQNVIFK